jgi:hypothetical protein
MRFTCGETRERLDAFGAGDLPHGEQMRVQTHLGGCQPCRSRFADAERVTRAVRSAMTVVPPPGYLESLPTRLDARQSVAAGARPAWLRLAPVGMAAAALVVLLLGSNLWDGTPADGDADPAFAPIARQNAQPTPAADAYDSVPRVARNVEKRGDLMPVQLVMMEPRAITPSVEPIPRVAMGRSKGPMMDSSRIEQLIATILHPRRDAARASAESFDVDLYASEEAVVLARQATYASTRAGYDGLAAFVSGSVSAIADVTLPLY